MLFLGLLCNFLAIFTIFCEITFWAIKMTIYADLWGKIHLGTNHVRVKLLYFSMSGLFSRPGQCVGID